MTASLYFRALGLSFAIVFPVWCALASGCGDDAAWVRGMK